MKDIQTREIPAEDKRETKSAEKKKVELDREEVKHEEVKSEGVNPEKIDTKEMKSEEMKSKEQKTEETETKETETKKTKAKETIAEEAKTEKAKEESKSIEVKTEGIRTEEVKAEKQIPESKEREQKIAQTGKNIVIGVILGLLIVLTGVYVGVTLYYRSHFMPNTSINGITCDNMDVATVVSLVDAQIQEYSLKVTGRNPETGVSGEILGIIDVDDIGMSYADTKDAVQDVLSNQNAFLWPGAYLKKDRNSYSLIQGIVFDESKLRETVSSWDACRKENMKSPEDAYISEYIDEKRGYEVIPETAGTELNMEKVLEIIAGKLHANETSLDLEDEQCYMEADVKSTDTNLNDAVNTANSWLSTEIVYDWNDNEVVLNAETLKDWITVKTGDVTLDEEAVSSFVKEQAKRYDTYGKSKNFVTTLGIELTLKSPNYGWKTDAETESEELIKLIYQGSKAEKEPVYSIKAMKKGMNDVGSSYVEADLTHQHLYVYQNGTVVFETDFVSGTMNSTPGCVTPPGIFGLTYKTTNAVLRGADYETPVSYWMPFYGNYGMHDATWRVNFGGTIYLEHGSHGCINLPLDSAATIYGYVSTGFPVICYYYEVDPLGEPASTEELSEEELLRQHEPTIGGSEEQSQNQEG